MAQLRPQKFWTQSRQWVTNNSTRAAMTVSISDMTVPPQKPEMIKQAQDTVDLITKNFKRGLITEEERYKRSCKYMEEDGRCPDKGSAYRTG